MYFLSFLRAPCVDLSEGARAPLPPAPLEASRGLYDWLLELSGGGLCGAPRCLGCSWGLSGDLGVVVGSHGAVLGRRWGRLEALLGLLGAILGPSWALLGASSGPLGTPMRLFGALSDTFGTCLRQLSEI